MALGDLNAVLAKGDGQVRLTELGQLVISPLSAESVPAEADDLRDELMALLPRPRLASLVIEVDHRIGRHGFQLARLSVDRMSAHSISLSMIAVRHQQ